MVTMGAMFGGTWLAMRGGEKPKKDASGPPIAASSKDEEAFIQYVSPFPPGVRLPGDDVLRSAGMGCVMLKCYANSRL